MLEKYIKYKLQHQYPLIIKFITLFLKLIKNKLHIKSIML